MLSELHIEDLGVIRRVDLVPGPWLTAITGETGAGKTMLVDALDLVVGGRADPTIVRAGAGEARIDARFVGSDSEVVLSRVIPANGRSRAYIDGRPVTVAALVAAAAGLVDLHGQHAHQQLLSAASQRAALDAFGEIDVSRLRAARARLTEIDAELATLGGDDRARARELDLARFQLAELDQAAVDDEDEESILDALEDTLAGAVEHRHAGAMAYDAITAEAGARDALGLAATALGGRAPFRELADRLDQLLAELDDVTTGIRDAADEIVQDPERLDVVRARRQQLRELCRKYGDDLAEVQRYHRDVAERVAALESVEARAAALDARRAAAVDTHRVEAAAVGAARRAAAPRLADAVTSRLTQLAMANAAVAVDVGDDDGSRVQFLLSANPGSALLPLSKVASGGELARTMLALRLVTVESDPDGESDRRGDADPGAEPDRAVARTLVFDEVDAGIGGHAATAVGRALAELGERHQVIVVTHLAQVAAPAATQISVVKHVNDDGSETTATAAVVAGDERVAEVARMLSGDTGGAAAELHARELLGEPVRFPPGSGGTR